MRSGNQPFEPTDEQRYLVETLTACGAPQSEIIKSIKKANGDPICVKTLQNHFKTELIDGLSVANSKVAGKLFSTAINGNVTAMIFWLKTRAKWKEADKSDIPSEEETGVEFIVRRAIKKNG